MWVHGGVTLLSVCGDAELPASLSTLPIQYWNGGWGGGGAASNCFFSNKYGLSFVSLPLATLWSLVILHYCMYLPS